MRATITNNCRRGWRDVAVTPKVKEVGKGGRCGGWVEAGGVLGGGQMWCMLDRRGIVDEEGMVGGTTVVRGVGGCEVVVRLRLF